MINVERIVEVVIAGVVIALILWEILKEKTV